MILRARHVVASVVGIFVIAVVAGVAILVTGAYDVAATRQHLRTTFWLLDLGARFSIRQRAEQLPVPALDDPGQRARGLVLYQRHCAQCHGAPGIAPEPFALGMLPAPANLAYTARTWPAADLFWVAKYGIKMSGMPAWEYRLDDDALWAIVAFTRTLGSYTVAEYRSAVASIDATGSARSQAGPGPAPAPVDAARGRAAMLQYACTSCHVVPGVVGEGAPVGPSLARIGSRNYIGGVLPNSTENMVRWLRDPQAVDPRSLMPALGLSERDARDMAAYLATLR